jgi:hypothetical protein
LLWIIPLDIYCSCWPRLFYVDRNDSSSKYCELTPYKNLWFFLVVRFIHTVSSRTETCLMTNDVQHPSYTCRAWLPIWRRFSYHCRDRSSSYCCYFLWWHNFARLYGILFPTFPMDDVPHRAVWNDNWVSKKQITPVSVSAYFEALDRDNRIEQ